MTFQLSMLQMMLSIQNLLQRLALPALLIGCALPAGAGSSAASSASDSIAASVGSISGSLVQSSNSSSRDKQVADGDYRIIEVASEDGRPGLVRLTLAAAVLAPPAVSGGEGANAGDLFSLFLPEQLLATTPLAEGATISARQRPYGLEFAAGQPRRAFFLALHDEWYRELQSTPLAL